MQHRDGEAPRDSEAPLSTCSGCGAELPAEETSAGLCRRCQPLDDGETELRRATTVQLPGEPTEEKTVDAYRLVQRLGEGGMGEVYLALQTEPIRRQVALKLIKEGANSKNVLRRFDSERQVLALMDHPNIAQVFDAGTTGDGRPYFVMELIRGLPITQYCDERRLGVRQRLELFLAVCDGVQHAHHRGILHRDLKPSNVLVTEVDQSPTVKVIDFGIAKAIGGPIDGSTLLTQYGQVVGTPQYMSPEQLDLSILEIDTRSDVYALGVLLYELLVGRRPFESGTADGMSFSELQRAIREQEPARPSTCVLPQSRPTERIAKMRATTPRGLSGVLRGDLDWIALTALEKDRNRRYGSPAELAADIRRHLRDEPILVGPPSLGYSVSKFVRRHRAAVIGAVAVFLVLLLGVVTSTFFALAQRQALRESERNAAALQAVNAFLNDDLLASAAPGEMGRDTKLIEVLDAASEKLGGRFEANPAIEAALRRTLGETYHGLGAYGAAEPHLERALELHRAIGGEDSPQSLGTVAALAALYGDMERLDEAEALFAAGREAARHSLGDRHEITLSLTSGLGIVYVKSSRLEAGRALLEETLTAQQELHGARHRDTLLSGLNYGALLTSLGRHREAETQLLSIFEDFLAEYGEDHPHTLDLQNALANAYLYGGRYADAEPLLQSMLETGRQTLGEAHLNLGYVRVSLGAVYYHTGRYSEAEGILRENLRIVREVTENDHGLICDSLASLAKTYQRAGRLDDAEATFLEGIRESRRLRGAESRSTAVLTNNLGSLYTSMGRLDDAERLHRQALEGASASLPEGHPLLANLLSNHGGSLTKLGSYEEAARRLLRADRIWRALPEVAAADLRRNAERLVELYEQSGQPEEADRWRARLSADGGAASPQQ